MKKHTKDIIEAAAKISLILKSGGLIHGGCASAKELIEALASKELEKEDNPKPNTVNDFIADLQSLADIYKDKPIYIMDEYCAKYPDIYVSFNCIDGVAKVKII